MNGKELAFTESSGESGGGIFPFEVEWTKAYQQQISLTKSNFTGVATSADFERSIGSFSSYDLLLISISEARLQLSTSINSNIIIDLSISSDSISPYEYNGACKVSFNTHDANLHSATNIFSISTGRRYLNGTEMGFDMIGSGSANDPVAVNLGSSTLKWSGHYTTYTSDSFDFSLICSCAIYGGKFKI